MILSFEEYQEAGGTRVPENEYNELEPMVEDLIDAYIKEHVPFWRILNLDAYGLDLTKVIKYQVDFLQAHGGVDCFVGQSDLNFKQATTSGFTYSVDNTKTETFYDLPLSSLAKSELDYQLKLKGLSNTAIW